LLSSNNHQQYECWQLPPTTTVVKTYYSPLVPFHQTPSSPCQQRAISYAQQQAAAAAVVPCGIASAFCASTSWATTTSKQFMHFRRLVRGDQYSDMVQMAAAELAS
jgi:hypothetical protein